MDLFPDYSDIRCLEKSLVVEGLLVWHRKYTEAVSWWVSYWTDPAEDIYTTTYGTGNF
jgi:hypothetical protein